MSPKRQIAGTIKIVTQWLADEIRPRKGRDPLPQIKVLDTRQDCLIEEAAIEEKLSAADNRRGRKERPVINLSGQSLVRIVPFTVVDEMAAAVLRNLFFGMAENVEFGVQFDMLGNHFKFLRFPEIIGIKECNPFRRAPFDGGVAGRTGTPMQVADESMPDVRISIQKFFDDRDSIVGRAVIGNDDLVGRASLLNCAHQRAGDEGRRIEGRTNYRDFRHTILAIRSAACPSAR